MMKLHAFIVKVINGLMPSSKHVRLTLTMVLLIQSIPMTTLQSAFDDLGAGARAPGMADTQVAIADDANALWYNPAGLVQLTDSEITTQYGQVLRGLDDGSSLGTTYLGFAHPYRRGLKSIGAAYHNFKADNLFNERTLVLSYGQRLNIQPFGWRGLWYGGANLKQLYHQYQPDRFTENALNDAGTASGRSDPQFSSGYGKAAYGVDLSALYQFGQGNKYSAGLMLTNVNRPNVSLNGGDDKAPFATKLGIAYKPKWGVVSSEIRRTKRLESQADTDLSFGAERFMRTGPLGMLIFRAGYASGSRDYKAITAGLGYAYARFRFDYAFNFPINNLADSSGSHRLGFSFKLGDASAPVKKSRDDFDINLLASFEHDSLAVYSMIRIFSKDHRLNLAEQDLLMLVLMRKYPLDDEGLKGAKSELRDLLRNQTEDSNDWTQVKYEFVRNLKSDEDRIHATQALERLVKGDAKSAHNRLMLLTEAGQNTNRIRGLMALALVEQAAQNYRDTKINPCIDIVRRLVDLMPTNDVVMRAYRQLLSMKLKTRKVEEESEVEFNTDNDSPAPEELPEAPQALVAPTTPESKMGEKLMDEKDALSKSFAASLGYYYQRKSDGADLKERRSLLQQMKAVYGLAGMDMSLINKELAELGNKTESKPTETLAPTAEPVKVKSITEEKAVSPKPQPKTKPGKVSSSPTLKSKVMPNLPPEWEKAWDYYRRAAARDITDHEKIELLEAMLVRFGEKGAAQINKELQRIRKRLE